MQLLIILTWHQYMLTPLKKSQFAGVRVMFLRSLHLLYLCMCVWTADKNISAS